MDDNNVMSTQNNQSYFIPDDTSPSVFPTSNLSRVVLTFLPFGFYIWVSWRHRYLLATTPADML